MAKTSPVSDPIKARLKNEDYETFGEQTSPITGKEYEERYYDPVFTYRDKEDKSEAIGAHPEIQNTMNILLSALNEIESLIPDEHSIQFKNLKNKTLSCTALNLRRASIALHVHDKKAKSNSVKNESRLKADPGDVKKFYQAEVDKYLGIHGEATEKAAQSHARRKTAIKFEISDKTLKSYLKK